MTSASHEDLDLSCHLCGDAFVFTAGEQELQRLRGLELVPTRCPQCRRRPPTLPYLPRVTR
jgi:putative zinc ribbon protein